MTGQFPTLSFNTARKYAANGQPITAAFDPATGTVAFVDHARLIEGVIRDLSPELFTRAVVLSRYDHNHYDYPCREDLPLLRAAHRVPLN
jgi:hypothetical protein